MNSVINKKFWEQRIKSAKSEFSVASNDPHLKTLELKCLNKYLPYNGYILEVGCGNGYNLKRIDRPNAKLYGVDIFEEMIRLANKREGNKSVNFYVADALNLPFKPVFDCVFTDRCIINIPHHLQSKSIENIAKALKKGGLFVMLEQYYNQLEKVNSLRRRLFLPEISVPEQNYYIKWNDIGDVIKEFFVIQKRSNPSSTYFFMSRILNAYIKKNKMVKYSDMLNRIGARLPQLGNWGTLELFTLKKK
jgi:SAM-dependent methyltransferase